MGWDPILFNWRNKTLGVREGEEAKMLHRRGEVKSRLRGSNREESCCIYGGK